MQVSILKDGKNIATVNAVDYVGLQALQVRRQCRRCLLLSSATFLSLQYQRPRSASVVAASSPCIVRTPPKSPSCLLCSLRCLTSATTQVCELTPSADHIPIIVETVSSRDESSGSAHQPRRSIVGLHMSPSLSASENSGALSTGCDATFDALNRPIADCNGPSSDAENQIGHQS